jgi:Bacterial Ig-like domain (group 3)
MTLATTRRFRAFRAFAVATIACTGALIALPVTPAAAGVDPVVTHFAVTAPTSAVAGDSVSFDVTAEDASNATVSSYYPLVHFTSSDGSAVLPSPSYFFGSSSFSVTFNTPGSQTIVATDTHGITGQATVNVTSPPATHFAVDVPASATTGSPVQATVTAEDASNAAVTDDTDTVHFTSSDGAAVVPSDATLVSGAATVEVTFNTAGSQTFTATDTITAAITGSAAVLVSKPAASLTVVLPANTTAGTAASVTVTATAADATVATGYAGTVHFTSTDGAAVLPADTTLTDGTGTFSVTFAATGTQSVTATDTGDASITGNDSSDVAAAATSPTTTTAGSTTTSLTAEVLSTDAGLPTGMVSFTVNGVSAGSTTLGSDQTATVSHTPGTGVQTVVATYSGDATFKGSTDSYVVTPPAVTTKAKSAHAKTKYGWYRSPVTVTFTCKAGSAPVVCPKPATLRQQGKSGAVHAVIEASDGGRRSITVHFNVDTTKPTLRVTHVKNGHTYRHSPHPKCKATDGLSGVASCTITTHKHGHRVDYTATAKDKAGNVKIDRGNWDLAKGTKV